MVGRVFIFAVFVLFGVARGGENVRRTEVQGSGAPSQKRNWQLYLQEDKNSYWKLFPNLLKTTTSEEQTGSSIGVAVEAVNQLRVTYKGKWSKEGTLFSVSSATPVLSTMMAGTPDQMKAEAQITDLLSKASELRLTPFVFAIKTPDSKTLVFSPADPESSSTPAPSTSAPVITIGGSRRLLKTSDDASTSSTTTKIATTTSTTTPPTTTTSTFTTMVPVRRQYEAIDFTYRGSWDCCGDVVGEAVTSDTASDFDFAEYDSPPVQAQIVGASSAQVFDDAAKENATGEWLADLLHPHPHHHKHHQSNRVCLYSDVRFPVTATVEADRRQANLYHLTLVVKHQIDFDVTVLDAQTGEARVQMIDVKRRRDDGGVAAEYKSGVERKLLKIIRSLTWFDITNEFFGMGSYDGPSIFFAQVEHATLDMRSFVRDGQVLPLFDPEVRGCEELKKNLVVSASLTPLTFHKHRTHYRRYLMKVGIINTHLLVLEVGSGLARTGARARVLRFASTNFDKLLSGADHVEHEIASVLQNIDYVEYLSQGVRVRSSKFGSLTFKDTQSWLSNPWLSAVRCVNLDQPAYLSMDVVPSAVEATCWWHPSQDGCRYTAPLSCSHNGLLDVIATLRIFNSYAFQMTQVVGMPALVDWQTIRHRSSISVAEHLAEWDFTNRMRHALCVHQDRREGTLTFCGLLTSIRFQQAEYLKGLSTQSEALVLDTQNVLINGSITSLETPNKQIKLTTKLQDVTPDPTKITTPAPTPKSSQLPPPPTPPTDDDYSSLMPSTRSVDATLIGDKTYNFRIIVTPGFDDTGADNKSEKVKVVLVSQAKDSLKSDGSDKQAVTESKIVKALTDSNQASRVPDGSIVFGNGDMTRITFRPLQAALSTVNHTV